MRYERCAAQDHFGGFCGRGSSIGRGLSGGGNRSGLGSAGFSAGVPGRSGLTGGFSAAPSVGLELIVIWVLRNLHAYLRHARIEPPRTAARSQPMSKDGMERFTAIE